MSGRRSDQRGDIECYQALAFAGRGCDSGDCAAHEAVAQYDPEVSGERGRRAEVSDTQEPKRARWVRDQADRLARDGSTQRAQATPQPAAAACGLGGTGFCWIV